MTEKAGIKWLREGDNNTRFFHAVLKRKHHNQVTKMTTPDGTSLDTSTDIHEGVVQYLQEFLGHKNEGELLDLRLFIDQVVTEEENKSIYARPSIEEIWRAILSIPVESSPGPDGFGSGFFKACEEIAQGEVENAVAEFFEGKQLPRVYTASFVALIHKVQQPTGYDKFRPISLCSVIYKTCSKIIVGRLAHSLPRMVSQEQGTFMPNRNIFENISLTQEMVKSIHKKTNGGNVLVKVDMSKAYDLVNWNFSDSCLVLIWFRREGM